MYIVCSEALVCCGHNVLCLNLGFTCSLSDNYVRMYSTRSLGDNYVRIYNTGSHGDRVELTCRVDLAVSLGQQQLDIV